ncbi:MAG TPA: family 78 glycoside hydrolase catalytic domain [Microlunatus sp.]
MTESGDPVATDPWTDVDPEIAVALAAATWIGPDEAETPPPGLRPAYLLRRSFRHDRQPGHRSQLMITAHGIAEAFLNGVRVGDDELTPGFSAYRKRLQVHRYDVTDLLLDGVNTVVVLLSDGWFRGRHGFQRHADGFGTRTGLLLAITEPAVAGGSHLASDEHWRFRRSHIQRADLMDGQSIDFGAYDPDWFTDAGSDDGWSAVAAGTTITTLSPSRLVAAEGSPIRQVGEIVPAALHCPRPGTVVLDLGEDINGWLRLPDLGPAGTRLTLTHGEVLDSAGLVDTGNLRAFDFETKQLLDAGQRDEVISSGRGEIFEPRHTTHGFRYVQIDGVPTGLDLSRARGIQVHTLLPRTGEFTCSDRRLEQLHEVVRRSLLTNACAVPTDCPQRERSGFTGDWQIFVGAAALLHDVAWFSRRWLRDLAADQWSDGRIPTIVPNPGGDQPSGIPFEDASAGSAGWGDAAVIVPWEMWRTYGDLDALREAYPAMRRWVDYSAQRASTERHPDRAAGRPQPAPHETYLLDTGFHFGEWLEPGVPPNPDPAVDHGIVATAYLHRSAVLTARTAQLLGHTHAARGYQRLAEAARAAWQAEYLLEDRLTEDRQAHYVRALAFDLVPTSARARLAARLVDLITRADTRLATGFLSTGLLLPVLSDAGYDDVAFRLLVRTGFPSWLGMVEAGATTMWEWWDGVAADGTAKGSLNHYSKGAVASFLHTHLAGLRLPESPGPDEAGYRRVHIQPTPMAGLQHAHTRQLTRQGPIAVSWQLGDGGFHLDIDLPPTTSATVALPDGTTRELVGGSHHLACSHRLTDVSGSTAAGSGSRGDRHG